MKKKILLAITPLLLGVVGCSPSGNFHPVGDIGEKISLDEAKDVATEIIKAQASSGAWLIEQGCQLLAVADMGILWQVLLDVSGKRQEAVDFFHREIKRIQ